MNEISIPQEANKLKQFYKKLIKKSESDIDLIFKTSFAILSKQPKSTYKKNFEELRLRGIYGIMKDITKFMTDVFKLKLPGTSLVDFYIAVAESLSELGLDYMITEYPKDFINLLDKKVGINKKYISKETPNKIKRFGELIIDSNK